MMERLLAKTNSNIEEMETQIGSPPPRMGVNQAKTEDGQEEMKAVTRSSQEEIEAKEAMLEAKKGLPRSDGGLARSEKGLPRSDGGPSRKDGGHDEDRSRTNKSRI
jgi:hypothetical protein